MSLSSDAFIRLLELADAAIAWRTYGDILLWLVGSELARSVANDISSAVIVTLVIIISGLLLLTKEMKKNDMNKSVNEKKAAANGIAAASFSYIYLPESYFSKPRFSNVVLMSVSYFSSCSGVST